MFFFETALNFMHISEMQKKIQKRSFASEIVAFEIVAGNSAYCCRNTCHRQLMREQTVLRFHIKLKVTFSNSIYFELTRKEGNSGSVLISAVFGTR